MDDCRAAIRNKAQHRAFVQASSARRQGHEMSVKGAAAALLLEKLKLEKKIIGGLTGQGLVTRDW